MPPKKHPCKGCSALETNPVTCRTCGIFSHPGTACFQRCAHPWQLGKLIDCCEGEMATSTAPTTPVTDMNSEFLGKIGEIFDIKFTKLENELIVFHSSLELLNSTISTINNTVKKLEQALNNVEEDIISELNDRNRKSYNLMFFTLIEDKSEPGAVNVRSILHSIHPDVCFDNVNVRRIGKTRADNKPRPVCVIFSSLEIPNFNEQKLIPWRSQNCTGSNAEATYVFGQLEEGTMRHE